MVHSFYVSVQTLGTQRVSKGGIASPFENHDANSAQEAGDGCLGQPRAQFTAIGVIGAGASERAALQVALQAVHE